MENISQKDINEICELLRTKDSAQLAGKLEKANIISALYVLNYLNVIEKLRKDTQIKDKDSKYPNSKKNDFEGFKKLLDKYYQLELHYLINTPEKFEGMYWLLYTALDRQHLICDFDDGIHPPTKIGKCENETHSDICDTNPSNQKLHLTYDYSEDNQKMDKRYPTYICDKCQKDINENAEGSISCDMEIVNAE